MSGNDELHLFTRTFSVVVDGHDWLGIDEFVSLFMSRGILSDYGSGLEGARVVSLRSHSFCVTFKADGEHGLTKSGNEFNQDHQHGKIYEYKGTATKITSRPIQSPTKLYTLYPVPAELTTACIQQVVEQQRWGDVAKINFCTFRRFPTIKNGYVHVHMNKVNNNQIKSEISIKGLKIYVTRPEEAHLPLCRFCKERGHIVSECLKVAYCTKCNRRGHSAAKCRTQEKTDGSEPGPSARNNNPAPSPPRDTRPILGSRPQSHLHIRDPPLIRREDQFNFVTNKKDTPTNKRKRPIRATTERRQKIQKDQLDKPQSIFSTPEPNTPKQTPTRSSTPSPKKQHTASSSPVHSTTPPPIPSNSTSPNGEKKEDEIIINKEEEKEEETEQQEHSTNSSVISHDLEIVESPQKPRKTTTYPHVHHFNDETFGLYQLSPFDTMNSPDNEPHTA